MGRRTNPVAATLCRVTERDRVKMRRAVISSLSRAASRPGLTVEQRRDAAARLRQWKRRHHAAAYGAGNRARRHSTHFAAARRRTSSRVRAAGGGESSDDEDAEDGDSDSDPADSLASVDPDLTLENIAREVVETLHDRIHADILARAALARAHAELREVTP